MTKAIAYSSVLGICKRHVLILFSAADAALIILSDMVGESCIIYRLISIYHLRCTLFPFIGVETLDI